MGLGSCFCCDDIPKLTLKQEDEFYQVFSGLNFTRDSVASFLLPDTVSNPCPSFYSAVMTEETKIQNSVVLYTPEQGVAATAHSI